MNIFDNLRQYQKPPRQKKELTEYEIQREKIKERKKQRKEILKAAAFIFIFLVFWFLLWYNVQWKTAGFIFFLCLSLLIFGTITPLFANCGDWFEKKIGEAKGSILGCLGMALGPILGVTVFVTSIPYWDLEKREEIANSPTVYITPYGECFHTTSDCYTIQGHRIMEISKYKAEQKGRRPCEICSSDYIDE